MTPQPPHRKIKPHHSETGISSEAVISAAVFMVILLGVGLILGLTNRTALTELAVPTYTNGDTMAAGDILYTTEEVTLSYAAGAGQENSSLTLPACTQVIVTTQPETNSIVGREDGRYWVHIEQATNRYKNGWIALAHLSEQEPTDCPETEEE